MQCAQSATSTHAMTATNFCLMFIRDNENDKAAGPAKQRTTLAVCSDATKRGTGIDFEAASSDRESLTACQTSRVAPDGTLRSVG